MYTPAEELARLCNERQFSAVVAKYEAEHVDEEDPHVLYQVFLAYSMLKQATEAEKVRQLLPEDMEHDARRDVLMMRIRSANVLRNCHELHNEAVQLHLEAGKQGDTDRQAVARLALARLYDMCGERGLASGQIELAFGLADRMSNTKWRENIALWYLVLGGRRGGRTQALMLVLRDPALKRRLGGIAAYLGIPTQRLARRFA